MHAELWSPVPYDLDRIEAIVTPTLEGSWKRTRKRDRITFRQGTFWMSFRLEEGPHIRVLGSRHAKRLGHALPEVDRRVVLRTLWVPDRFNDVLIALEAFQARDPSVVVLQLDAGGAPRVLPR